MKQIKLIPDIPFHNYVDISVMDFPAGSKVAGRGFESDKMRCRCKITVEFARWDVEQLKKRGLDFDGAMKYYEEWIYEVIKFHLAQDWQCVGGYDDVMKIIEERLSYYYGTEK